MNKQQANAKDRKFSQHRKEFKLFKKVGSHFKKCTCGSQQVMKFHEPLAAGMTHYCIDCSRVDEATGFNS